MTMMCSLFLTSQKVAWEWNTHLTVESLGTAVLRVYVSMHFIKAVLLFPYRCMHGGSKEWLGLFISLFLIHTTRAQKIKNIYLIPVVQNMSIIWDVQTRRLTLFSANKRIIRNLPVLQSHFLSHGEDDTPITDLEKLCWQWKWKECRMNLPW